MDSRVVGMGRSGIAGFGFVGQAVYKCINQSTSEVFLYDPPKGLGSLENLKQCDNIFCCLPSPTLSDGKQDFSAYEELLDSLDGCKGIIIIKSTVLLSNIEKYFNKLSIVMNPEFLNQNTSYEDFYNQKLIVLGGKVDLCMRVEEVYRRYFSLGGNPEFFYCTEKEAIDIKYVHNTYHAYKVLFWNYVNATRGNHRKMFNAYSKITGNTNEMSNICADGKPGYGGACFPKDVTAANSEYPHDLTKFMIKYNKKLRGR
jgi:UDPglucose 6-dehydrogenase